MVGLTSLEAGFKWCEKDQDGSWCFRTDIQKKHGRLSLNMLLALALNQLCCELGLGMVYATFHDGPELIQSFGSNEEFELYHLKRSVPGLLYSPESWSPEKRDLWRNATPAEQVERSWAPYGWLPQQAMVLPFSHVISTEKCRISKPTLPSSNMNTPVTLIAGLGVEGVYVGPTQQMRDVCKEFKCFDDTKQKLLRHEWVGRGWSPFSGWKNVELSDAIWKLDGLAQSSHGVVQYRSTLPELQRVHLHASRIQEKLENSIKQAKEQEVAKKDAAKRQNADLRSGLSARYKVS